MGAVSHPLLLIFAPNAACSTAGEGRLEKEGVRPLRGGVGAVAHPVGGSLGAGQDQGRGEECFCALNIFFLYYLDLLSAILPLHLLLLFALFV